MRILSMVILCIVLGTACKQDDGSADFSTGMKAYGDKDYKEALKWLTKASEKGHTEAQFYLGSMYYHGQGMEQPNYKEALIWYGEAAKKGNDNALNDLAVMYDEGKGVEKNFRKADRLWLLAAQQGNATAIRNFSLKSVLMSSKPDQEYWSKLAQNKIDNWKPKQLSARGSGFYITKEYILTNAHVVCSNDNISSGQCDRYDEVRTPYYRLNIEKIDTDVDLALLKVVSSRKDSISAKIRSGSDLQLGEDIAVFGYPLAEKLSFEGNFTIGNVSAREGRPTISTPSDFFQFTAPIQSGNSGGPVLDAAGNLVGVATRLLISPDSKGFYNIAQNINFAVSLKAIKNFLKNAGIAPYSSSKASSSKDWIVWEWEQVLEQLANHPDKRAINDLKEHIIQLERIKSSLEQSSTTQRLDFIHRKPNYYWRKYVENIEDVIKQIKKEEISIELDSSYGSRPKKWTEVARAAEEFTVPILCFKNKE